MQEPLEHDEYDRIEEAFNDAVSVSLEPRGPDFLYEVIDGFALDAGASAVDVGCGEGRQTIELARRFSLTVQGVDPLERRMDVARDALSSLPPALAARVTFHRGTAEEIPAPDASVDLILCREMLYVVADLVTVFTECRRIVKPTGKLVVYQLFATDWLEPEEAARFLGRDSSGPEGRGEALRSVRRLGRLDGREHDRPSQRDRGVGRGAGR